MSAKILKLYDAHTVRYETSDGKYIGIIEGAKLARAKRVAELRQSEAEKANKPDRYGFVGDGRSIHVLGAIGELAVAEALGIEWSGSVNTFKAPDIEDCVQVRTRSTSKYGTSNADLLIRPNDNDDEYFVHVTADLISDPCVFTIHGYILGRDGKLPKWRQTYGRRPPAYFIPASDLGPIGP